MPSNLESASTEPGSRGTLNDDPNINLYTRVVREFDNPNDDIPGPSTAQAVSNGKRNQDSVESFKSLTTASSSELGYPCRICRCDEENIKVVRCPCKCKGSVGFVHLECLKQWILHHRGSRCEICNTHYRLPNEDLGILYMIRTFFSTHYVGLILKHLILAASIIPLARIVMHQILMCVYKLNPEESPDIKLKEIFWVTCGLFTSSALFFNFFDYISRRFTMIQDFIGYWWMFDDFELFEPEDRFAADIQPDALNFLNVNG